MNSINPHLVVAVVVIAGVSIWHHLVFGSVETSRGTSFTSIGVGAFVFLGVLALLDMVPGLSGVTSGIAMLAMLTVLLVDLPPLLDMLNLSLQAGSSSEPPGKGKS